MFDEFQKAPTTPIILKEEERGIYSQVLFDSEKDLSHTQSLHFFVDKAIDLVRQRIVLAEQRGMSAPDFHEPSV